MSAPNRTNRTHKPKTIRRLQVELLSWYEQNQRDLPWRRTKDPYAIWVSEIMLQQTRVAAVVERFKAFMERFPDVMTLAEAPEQDVLAQWSGLGYYRRARMLHKAAQFVAEDLRGRMPTTAVKLRDLQGIGVYTAAAIASIAHDEPVAVVDGNVERVICRLQGWEAADGAGKSALRCKVEALAGELVDPLRPGDFNQAVMELGATVCTPRKPQCLVCPWSVECRTLGEHKMPKRPPMMTREIAYALVVRAGRKPDVALSEVLLEQRSVSNSVMPGMWELPSLCEVAVPEHELRMTLRHAIMQVNYLVRVRTVFEEDIEKVAESGGLRRWIPIREAENMALTGLARKVLSRAGLLRGSERRSINAIAAQPRAKLL